MELTFNDSNETINKGFLIIVYKSFAFLSANDGEAHHLSGIHGGFRLKINPAIGTNLA
jgi:hypothetical protein